MYQVHITVGCNKLTYVVPISTPILYLNTSKLHWNSPLLTPVPNYLHVDIKNFYLNNPILNHDYYKIAIILIPKNIINNYDLMENQIDVLIYVNVYKFMYGLVQAGVDTHTALKDRLLPFGCAPTPITL